MYRRKRDAMHGIYPMMIMMMTTLKWLGNDDEKTLRLKSKTTNRKMQFDGIEPATCKKTVLLFCAQIQVHIPFFPEDSNNKTNLHLPICCPIDGHLVGFLSLPLNYYRFVFFSPLQTFFSVFFLYLFYSSVCEERPPSHFASKIHPSFGSFRRKLVKFCKKWVENVIIACQSFHCFTNTSLTPLTTIRYIWV